MWSCRYIYHQLTGEKEGEETKPTFYMYRHLDKPYHVDHILCHQIKLKIWKFVMQTNGYI